jgi:sn-glycerol 3-phosphate transport system ATP-binding protein
MGRAIVRDPQVFLFDEPLSNLDAKLRVQMRLEIKSLQRRLGVTSIYVTHDQVEAMTLGDKLMVLNGGYVEQYGSPIDLYERPATTFVAGFIGSPAMNFLSVDGGDGQATLTNGAVIPSSQSLVGATTLGIRPEHLVVDADGPFRLKVGMVEQLGANTLVHGTLDGTTEALVVSLPGVQTLHAEEVVTLSCPPNALHFFGADSKRID